MVGWERAAENRLCRAAADAYKHRARADRPGPTGEFIFR